MIQNKNRSEYRREYDREYKRKFRNTPGGYKKSVISKWKYHGLKGDYNLIFDKYMNTTHCQKCNVEFTKEKKGGRQKNMDHDHLTGKFRMVCCQICNTTRLDNTKNKNNTSGHKGISYNKQRNVWRYQKNINNKKFEKRCKCKITVLTYKFCYLLLINHSLKNNKPINQ